MVLLQQDEWKFVITVCGAQYVMMILETKRLLWYADNLDYHSHVRNIYLYIHTCIHTLIIIVLVYVFIPFL